MAAMVLLLALARTVQFPARFTFLTLPPPPPSPLPLPLPSAVAHLASQKLNGLL
jgi:hypothetical protein